MATQKYAAHALRTVDKDGKAYGDFQWPKKGKVVCPDWRPTKECGNGFHGLLHGEGDACYLDLSDDALWQVVGLTNDELKQTIDLNGKVKFPSCTVVFTGTRQDSIAYIQNHDPLAYLCVFGTATAGYGGTATAGDSGTATAGHYGTATAGYGGTATAGYRGIATAGYRGIATAGDYGTVTAGECGTLMVKYWDNDAEIYRFSIAYVGENGIQANRPYRLDDAHHFVEAHQ